MTRQWPDPRYPDFIADDSNLLFVYGSLLPGCRLYSMIRPAVTGWVDTTVSDYQVMLHPRHSMFPYLVADPGKAASGAAFQVRRGRDLAGVVAMERGAGYELSLLDADRRLWGFVYPEQPSKMRPLPLGVQDWRDLPLTALRG